MRRTSLPGLGLALAASLAIGACSSDSTTDTGVTTTCTVTYTGAATGSVPCVAVSAYSTATGLGAVTITSSSGSPSFNAALGFPGVPATKSYKNSDSGASGGVTATQGTTAIWFAQAGGATGNYTLTLSSVGTAVSGGSGATYAIHGSLTGSLPAPTGSTATGTVTVSVTF